MNNTIKNKKEKPIVLYLLLILGLWVFCFVTLKLWLLPYSVAYSENGEMTIGYFLYATIGLLFSTPAPFVSMVIISLFKEKIGYHIRGNMQRKGYASEAAKAVRDWTFEHTPFEKVYSYMSVDNIPSQKTAMSYGAVFEKECKDETGEIIQVYVFIKHKNT